MAGAQDWIQSGVVQQPDISGSFESGVRLALAQEQMQQQKEQIQQSREQLEMKKADWLAHQVAGASSIVDDSARAMKFKQIGMMAPKMGINWDPASEAILSKKENAQTIQQGMANIMGMPYNHYTSAAMDFMNSMGDPAATEQMLMHGAELNQRMMAMQQQVRHQQFQMGLDNQKAFSEVQSKAMTESKDQIDVLTNANRIQDIAMDPEERNSPANAESAKAFMAKNLFPGGVIRGSEMEFMDEMVKRYGLSSRVSQWLRKTEGKGSMPDEVWFDVAKLAQKMGSDADALVQSRKTSLAGHLAPGMNVEDVFGGIPKFQPQDLRPSFPSLFPEQAAQAQTAKAKEPIVKWAATQGVKLDPNDPLFTTKARQLVKMFKERTAQANTARDNPAGAGR